MRLTGSVRKSEENFSGAEGTIGTDGADDVGSVADAGLDGVGCGAAVIDHAAVDVAYRQRNYFAVDADHTILGDCDSHVFCRIECDAGVVDLAGKHV